MKTSKTIALFTLPNFTVSITQYNSRSKTKYIVEAVEGYKTIQFASYDSLPEAVEEFKKQITD